MFGMNRKNKDRVIRELRADNDTWREIANSSAQEAADFEDALREIANAPDSKSGTAAKFQRIAREALAQYE